MQILQVVKTLILTLALGTFLSFVSSLGLFWWFVRQFPRTSAIGLQALKAITWYNPIFWLLIVASYVLAFWVVRK